MPHGTSPMALRLSYERSHFLLLSGWESATPAPAGAVLGLAPKGSLGQTWGWPPKVASSSGCDWRAALCTPRDS